VHLLVNEGLWWYQDTRCNDKNYPVVLVNKGQPKL